MTRTEYKALWRERNYEHYRAQANKTQRAWYKKNKRAVRAWAKKRRQRAVDRGRCGICVTRYRTPDYKTCFECREAAAMRRQIKRELAA